MSESVRPFEDLDKVIAQAIGSAFLVCLWGCDVTDPVDRNRVLDEKTMAVLAEAARAALRNIVNSERARGEWVRVVPAKWLEGGR